MRRRAPAMFVLAALEASIAHAQSPPVPTVWYRASEACPTADAFLARLRERGVEGRIAGVGDRVDFVVTLGGSAEGHAGRLERQTDAGTVAVRELSAPTCAEVAEGIALGLALAFDPRSATSSTPAPAPAVGEPPPAAVVPPPVPAPSVGRDRPPQPAPAPASASHAWAAGAHASVVTGVAPGALIGGALFVERAWRRPGVVSPSLRLGVGGLLSSSEVPAGDVAVRVGALRLEGCPLELSLGPAALRPCASAEAGVLSAEGSGPKGLAETRFWGAGAAHARFSWAPVPALAVEAQLGVVVPFSRYSLERADPPEVLHRADIVAVAAGIGAAYRWQ
jgi:hypothetical protein